MLTAAFTPSCRQGQAKACAQTRLLRGTSLNPQSVWQHETSPSVTGWSPDDGGTRRPKCVLRGRAVTFRARARDPDHEALKRCVCTAEENRKTSPNELRSFQRFERVVMLASEGAGPGAFGGVCAFKGHLRKEARQPGCRVTSRPVAVPSSSLDGPPRGVRREAGAGPGNPGLCGAAGPSQASSRTRRWGPALRRSARGAWAAIASSGLEKGGGPPPCGRVSAVGLGRNLDGPGRLPRSGSWRPGWGGCWRK